MLRQVEVAQLAAALPEKEVQLVRARGTATDAGIELMSAAGQAAEEISLPPKRLRWPLAKAAVVAP